MAFLVQRPVFDLMYTLRLVLMWLAACSRLDAGIISLYFNALTWSTFFSDTPALRSAKIRQFSWTLPVM